MRVARSIVIGAIALVSFHAWAVARRVDHEPNERVFAFEYDATIVGLAPGRRARVWLPVPPSNAEQTVAVVSSNLPDDAQLNCDPQSNNQIRSFQATADASGEIVIRCRYRVTRRAIGIAPAAGDVQAALDADLKPNALVPVGGKPATLLAGHTFPTDPLALGRALYDLVDDHMAYRKDKPGWGRGDAAWACDSRFGNCTDFHSLFISLARTEHLPAAFEIGFGIPETRGAGSVAGYHCWAKFFTRAEGWVPVDISEANRHPERRDYFFSHLDENRVTFSTGRDLTLVPAQAGPPLNFFVYPYAEVDGQPWPADRVHTSFAYADEPDHTPSTQP